MKERALTMQKHFKDKRDFVLERLEQMNVRPAIKPDGTFYIWVDLSNLPEPINDGMNFFKECLKEKVIIVPGEFFDVNPGKRRLHGRYKGFCRLSFGPNKETLERGLLGIESVLRKFRSP